jgi:PTS system cellobiose-specific IIA component
MDLIVNSGNASSLAIEAIHAARYGDFAAADHKLQESSEASVKAHNIQAELIRADLEEGKRIEINLLLVHAQDHLMNALTIKTLAGELIEILRANAKTKEEEIKG